MIPIELFNQARRLGGVTRMVRTSSDGRAIVEHASTGEAKVIVDGTTKCTVRCPTEVVVHIA